MRPLLPPFDELYRLHDDNRAAKVLVAKDTVVTLDTLLPYKWNTL